MKLPLFFWDDSKNASNLAKHGISFEAAKRVLVAYTWLDEDDGTEHIRIVSARRATRIERKTYEQGT